MFKNADGQWTSRSTTHRDKAGAVRCAEAFSMRLTSAEFGFVRNNQRNTNDVINPAFDCWLDYQRAQNTYYIWRSYRSIVKKFRKFLATKPKIKRLRHITSEIAMEFRRWAAGRSASKVTVSNNLIALRSAFNYFLSRDIVGENPFAQKRHGERIFFSESSPRRDTYTDTEYSKIITSAEPGDRPILILSYEPPVFGGLCWRSRASWPLDEELRCGVAAIGRFTESGDAKASVRAKKTGPHRPYAA